RGRLDIGRVALGLVRRFEHVTFPGCLGAKPWIGLPGIDRRLQHLIFPHRHAIAPVPCRIHRNSLPWIHPTRATRRPFVTGVTRCAMYDGKTIAAPAARPLRSAPPGQNSSSPPSNSSRSESRIVTLSLRVAIELWPVSVCHVKWPPSG